MSYTGFRNLGIERYQRSLQLLKRYTTATFTKKQGFDINKTDDLTKSQKAKIRRYWRELDRLTSRPHEQVKIRDKQKRVAVQKASFHEHYLGKFNTAFVPSDGVTVPVIKYDKKTKAVSVKIGKIERRVFKFDKVLLATDPEAAIKKIMDKAVGAKMFKVQCGQFENNYMSTNSLDYLTKLILKYQNKYTNTMQWLNGLVAYYYEKDADYDNTVNAIQAGKDRLKKSRLSQKRINMKGR